MNRTQTRPGLFYRLATKLYPTRSRRTATSVAAFVVPVLLVAAALIAADRSSVSAQQVPVVVTAPIMTASPATSFDAPVMVSDTTGLNILSYQFVMNYDPTVVTLQNPPVSFAGTMSSGMALFFNPIAPGQLLVSAFTAAPPLTGSGVLFNFKFNAVGPIGSSSPITWASFQFNEQIPQDLTIDGLITINVAPQIQFSASSYIDDESQSATIRVVRTGDTSGTASVDLNMSDGTGTGGPTCTSGVDYINTPVTPLSFGIGETVKTVSVPLCGDLITDAFETVNLSLTNISGAGVGSPTSAVLTINDTANQFRSTVPIDIILGSPSSPNPSTINVVGGPTVIGSMRVSLYDLSHVFPDNIDVLLVGPTGAKYVLMADTGGPFAINDPPTVTLTFSDIAAQTLPDSATLFTDAFKPTSCETPVLSFAAPAPAGPYVEPGCVLARPVTQSMFGAFGLTSPNGTWQLFVRDDAGLPVMMNVNGVIAGGWGLEFLPPTSAGVEISGRVLTSDGRGIRNAVVTITRPDGSTRTAVSSTFGYYRFDGIEAGESVVISAYSRSFRFKPRVVQVFDSISDLDLVGLE